MSRLLRCISPGNFEVLTSGLLTFRDSRAWKRDSAIMRQANLGPAHPAGWVIAQTHSERRTLMGSMDAARCAGSNDASDARIRTKIATKASAGGSKALTPKRKEHPRSDGVGSLWFRIREEQGMTGPESRIQEPWLARKRIRVRDRRAGAGARAPDVSRRFSGSRGRAFRGLWKSLSIPSHLGMRAKFGLISLKTKQIKNLRFVEIH